MNDDLKTWATTMSANDRKVSILVCLDEYEAAAESFAKRGNNQDQASIKVAKAWCERQKHMLRALGYRKRMPIIGRKTLPSEGIFGEGDDEGAVEDAKNEQNDGEVDNDESLEVTGTAQTTS